MPFYPEEVEFHVGETEKVIDFHDSGNGKSPWVVNRAKIAGYSVLRERWTFANVGPHPDEDKKDTWMQGTLKLEAGTLTPGGPKYDVWLDTNWPKSGDTAGTLEMTIGCASQPRPLTVKLKA